MSKITDQIVEEIAKKYLGIDLETRNCDRLDFHDLSVWQIKKALDEAFYSGFKMGEAGR